MPRQLPQPDSSDIDIQTVLSAMADPVRFALLRSIYRERGPIRCSAVAEEVDVTAPTVSHHWRVLREAGLTSTVVEGRERLIRLRHEELEERFPGLLAATLTHT